MHTIVWDFLPAPQREGEFVKAYGPDGDWVELFRRAAGYLGTELVAIADRPGWYRTVDRWESKEAYDAFLREHRAAYARLDEACQLLTAAEVCISK